MATSEHRNDYGRAWAAASIAGSLATVLIGSLALARHPEEFLGMLAFGVYLLIVIAPVWMIGVAVIGLPSLRLLEIFRLDRRVSAVALGTVVTGGIWFAFTYGSTWPTDLASQLAMAWKPTLVGALAGAISGYAGWRFGHRPVAEPQP